MAVNEGILAGLHSALCSPQPLLRTRDFVRIELEHGVSRSEVLDQLESLRGSHREQDENVVLEVMDFVTGWSSPHLRV